LTDDFRNTDIATSVEFESARTNIYTTNNNNNNNNIKYINISIIFIAATFARLAEALGDRPIPRRLETPLVISRRYVEKKK
jgi:hypothetical protein